MRPKLGWRLQIDLDNAKEIDRLRALNAQLIEALKVAEWGSHICYEGGTPACPFCDYEKEGEYAICDGKYQALPNGTHRTDCKIGIALAAAEKEKE
jgi:hypothetical protein